MPFDKFYEKSDKETLRQIKSVSAAFSLLIVVFISVCGLYKIYDNYQSKQSKEKIRIDRVAAFCTKLPKPEQFNLVKAEKPVIKENESIEVIFRYQTERDSAEIIPLFITWFDSNNWKRISSDELIFKSDDRTVAIKSDDNFSTQYNIYCSAEKSDIEFGLYDLSY